MLFFGKGRHNYLLYIWNYLLIMIIFGKGRHNYLLYIWYHAEHLPLNLKE